MKNNDFQILSDREFVLKRPAIWIGSVESEERNDYVLSDNKFDIKKFNVIPALLKIINEIIDNSVDEAIKTNFKFSTDIDIKIESNHVVVSDNGRGIPVVKHEDEYQPKLCWSQIKAGSNFKDGSDHTQIGQNGSGSALCNIWSKKFIGETDDGEKSYKITFTDNASDFKESIGISKNRGTTVTFWPDLERFKLKEITQDHIDAIYQRVLCLANMFTEIKFKFNKKLIKVKKFQDFAKLFGEAIIYDSENIKFAVVHNSSDDFKQFSYVNGLRINDGGVHIDTISSKIVDGIKEKLIKKYKTIKPGDIKNKLTIVCFIKNFPTPKFNSQQKEKLTNSISEFNNFANINYDKIIPQILKCNSIIDPIIEVYKIKEEFKKRQELKGLEKTQKKIKSDKYTPAIGEDDCLFLCEGYSAVSGMLSCLGRNGIAYYELKGKVMNVSNETSIANNKELSELYKIIKNSMVIDEMRDGDFYELEIDGKTYIVNENDVINIEGKIYDVKEILKDK